MHAQPFIPRGTISFHPCLPASLPARRANPGSFEYFRSYDDLEVQWLKDEGLGDLRSSWNVVEVALSALLAPA